MVDKGLLFMLGMNHDDYDLVTTKCVFAKTMFNSIAELSYVINTRVT